MSEEGSRFCPKKTDDICGGAEESGLTLNMSGLKCILRCLDIKTYLILFLLIPSSVFTVHMHGQKITYFLRPLWESPPKPFHEIPHYYHQNISMQNLCKLHGWKIRDSPRRVYDAVLFSNEVDLLKIRWKELHPYVTEFVLLESNSTFTGLPKPFVFSSVRDRFAFVEPRLTYGQVPGRFKRGKNPFVEEAYQRLSLDYLLKQAGIQDDDLLIMSDVDEIPSGHTIDLLRWCDDIPPVLHLRLKNYLYSFEFLHDRNSWRASVHVYKSGETKYAHYRQSDVVLADSGWHCSFCFRRISEFVFKMKAYSHVDRVRFLRFLNPRRIQRVICRGGDLFDMLPEEYSFKEIIAKMGDVPHSYSAVDLPGYVLEEAERFRFLLPGNCVRESG